MAGYEDTKQKIISTLMGRPVGTEIQPENHQDYALNMLDYIRSLELIATSTLIGVAESNSTPVQPNDSRVCYIAGVAQNQTVTFENFIGENGNPISVTTGDMEGVFIILMWNTQYWSAQTFSTNIISQSESATFYYRYNIRKTYESIALMNADVASPIGTDGKYIKIGDIVTVVNSTTPSENGIYSYEGATDGWKYQSSFNFQLEQIRSQNTNTAPSSKLLDDELVQLRSDLTRDLSKIKSSLYANYIGTTWNENSTTTTDASFYSYPDYKIKDNLVMPNIVIIVNDNGQQRRSLIGIRIGKVIESGSSLVFDQVDFIQVYAHSLGSGFMMIPSISLTSKPEYAGCNIFLSVSGGMMQFTDNTLPEGSYSYALDNANLTVGNKVSYELKFALFNDLSNLDSEHALRSSSLNMDRALRELKELNGWNVFSDKLKNADAWMPNTSYPLNNFSVNNNGEMILIFTAGKHQAINNKQIFTHVNTGKIVKLSLSIKRTTDLGGALDIGCSFGYGLGSGYTFDGYKSADNIYKTQSTVYKTINPTSVYEKYEIYYNYLSGSPIISIGSHNSKNKGDTFVIKDITFSVIESDLKLKTLDNSKGVLEDFINSQVNKTVLLNLASSEHRKVPFVGTYSGYWNGNVGGEPVLDTSQEGYVCMDGIACTEDELVSFVNFHTISGAFLGVALDADNKIIKIFSGQDNILSTDINRSYLTIRLPSGTKKFAPIYDERKAFGSYVNNDTYLLFTKSELKASTEIPVTWLDGSFIWNNTGGSDPTKQPGMVGAASGYSTSAEYIPYISGMIVSIICDGSSTNAITYYDADKNYIGALASGIYNDLKITPPSGTAYIRFTLNNFNIPSFKLAQIKASENFVTEEKLASELNDLGHPITPSDGDLQTFINSNRSLILGVGTWNITTPLTIPSNTKIVGIRGATVLKLSGIATSIINLYSLQSDIGIQDITFDGGTQITPSATNATNLRNRVGEGTKCGIYASGYIKNTFISGCEFRNFDLAGIRLFRTHSLYVRTFKITDNVFLNNFYGLLSDVRSEYHTVIGCTFSYNQVGCFIAGGNNFMGTCHFEANAAGCVVSGTAGDNDSHGSITGSSFNHNLVFGIAIININNGFTFDGCHVFDGVIKMYNSKGFVYVGGMIAGRIDNESPNIDSINMIHSNLFFKSYGGGTITDLTSLDLKNNRFVDGSDSSSINNSI